MNAEARLASFIMHIFTALNSVKFDNRCPL